MVISSVELLFDLDFFKPLAIFSDFSSTFDLDFFPDVVLDKESRS